MDHKYSHILTPLRIHDVVLKSRLMTTKCVSQELQGPEGFPAEATMKFAENCARSGAAIVTCSTGAYPDENGSYGRSSMHMDSRPVKNSFNRMIDRIHAHGSLASAGIQASFPANVQISVIRDSSVVTNYGSYDFMAFDNSRPEISRDQIRAVIDNVAWQCKDLKILGFDMVNIHMSYRRSVLAQSLSPALNQRTDEYGGSPENRIRLCREMFSAIKAACGPNFLIECQISGEEEQPYGYTVEDFLDYCQMLEGLVDIFQIRAFDMALSHPSSLAYPRHEPITLRYAEALKKRGVKGVVSPSGGFQDLDDIERFLAEGKCDLVGMARAFIADPDYGRKLYAGAGADVVPCIRCDKCHGAVCSVNPKHGLAHVADGMFDKETAPRKVAVIGGGPAGMKAALTAAERGHRVTLFEKTGRLGGQLIHADYMDFKWSLKDYKDYLIRKIAEAGVDVRLNTEATRELVEAGHYDAVIAACGSVGKTGPVPGADGKNVWKPMDIYGRESELGKTVAVIGGASIGTETALYLARLGLNVTLITRQGRVAYDNTAHGRDTLINTVETMETLRVLKNAVTTRIDEGHVYYADQAGAEHAVDCDSVVFSAGRTPLIDECMRFAGLTPKFFIAGDCNTRVNEHYCTFRAPAGPARDVEGDVRHSTFTGYTAAMEI